jgi:hypothetical protein
MIDNTPTFGGRRLGPETAQPAGNFIPSHVALAAANDAKFGGLSTQPEPCYCGCCNMTRSAN